MVQDHQGRPGQRGGQVGEVALGQERLAADRRGLLVGGEGAQAHLGLPDRFGGGAAGGVGPVGCGLPGHGGGRLGAAALGGDG